LSRARADPSWQQKEHARNVLLPQIQDVAATMFRSNRNFDKAVEAEHTYPISNLGKLCHRSRRTLSIETEPAGAESLEGL